MPSFSTPTVSVRNLALSASLIAAAATVMTLAGADTALAKGTAVKAAPTSPYYGRWTVEDPQAPFSTRGREYKTVDVAPCGNNFCGVSVGANGRCGPVLFRFLGANRNAEMLKGHGKWGSARKNVIIYPYETEHKGVTNFSLMLGDGYNIGGRSGNMPKYEAEYIRSGAARCTVRS